MKQTHNSNTHKVPESVQKKATLPSLKVIGLFLLFAVIFGIFFYFRIGHLSTRVIFDWDQERDAFQIYDLLVNHKLALIGPRVVGPQGFFLGPYYTYLLAPFYVFSGMNPHAVFSFVFTYTLLFATLGFLILKKLFKLPLALAFFALWGTHSLLSVYDLLPWNPLLTPLSILATFALLKRIFDHHKRLDMILLGLLVGVSISFHFQYVFILPIVFVVLFREKYYSKNRIGDLLLMKLSAVSTLLPLVIFDLRHQFINTHLFLQFFTPTGASKDLLSFIPVITNALVPFTRGQNVTLSALLYLTVFGLALFLSFKKTGFYKSFFLGIALSLITVPLAFMYYGKRPSEYYFVFLYPLIFITVIEFFTTVKWHAVGIILVILFMASNIQQSLQIAQVDPYGLYSKTKVVQKMAAMTKDSPYRIGFDLPPGRENGFHYLMQYYNVKKTSSEQALFLEVREPHRESDTPIGVFGVRVVR